MIKRRNDPEEVFMLRRIALAAAALTIAMPATAHHGWNGYDTTKTVAIEAAVMNPRYANPHGQIELMQGKKRWTVILAPVTRMDARGLSEAALKVGARVKVEGYQKLNDANELRAERITVAGKTVELR